MKNCLIIHGCPDQPEAGSAASFNKHWMPWAASQLESRGIKTLTPHMPAPWAPVYEQFKAEFEKYPVNESTILIGHSCGCAFLVRWLGETKQKIAKLILVAPWKVPTPGDIVREQFYGYSIDSTIQERVGEIVLFTSNNEEEDGKKSVNMFHAALGSQLIELKGKGHFTLDDMGTEEFPELIQVATR